MTIRRFYLFMLFLPLILPVASFAVAAMLGYDAVMTGMPMFLRFLIICSMIGGIPYFFFALGMVCWCGKKSAQDIKKISWFLPWIFTPICGLFFMVAFYLQYPGGNAVQGALIMAAFCVPVGFIYVFFVHLLTRIATSAGIIK